MLNVILPVTELLETHLKRVSCCYCDLYVQCFHNGKMLNVKNYIIQTFGLVIVLNRSVNNDISCLLICYFQN